MKLKIVLLGIFLVSWSGGAWAEDEDAKEEDKPAFVPSKFSAPSVNSAALHFFDYFPVNEKIGNIWQASTAKKDGVNSEIEKYDGVWEIGQPSEVAIEGDAGLIVKSKAKHHAIAAKLQKPFELGEDNTLVMQYEVKYEEGQECGGGYVKLLSAGAEKELRSFNDKTSYSIMFGPDKCGTSGKVHLIFRYKNPINGSIHEHHSKQPSNLGTTYWDDHKTHLYTLIIKPDGQFLVLVDEKEIIRGNILYDVVPPVEPPKEIFDPSDKKPADWDDREEIPDETAVKPEDWDENAPKEIVDETAEKPSDWLEDEPELIPDPSAEKPSDWDTELDGDWEPPQIDNPACKDVSGCGPWKRPVIQNPKYKGKWMRPKIKNPAYKGVWTARLIPNPHYFEPTPFEGLAPITAIGIELWTMSKNIIFDNVLLCDSETVASEIAAQTFRVKKAEEARLAASQGEGSNFFSAFIDAANERPWLWAVYVLALLIPILLIGVCCFGRKSSSTPQTKHFKKTDVLQEDDEVPQLIDEEDDEQQQQEKKAAVRDGKSPSSMPDVEKRRKGSQSSSASRSESRASKSPSRTAAQEKKLAANPVTPQTMKDMESSSGGEDEEVDVEGVDAQAETKGKKAKKQEKETEETSLPKQSPVQSELSTSASGRPRRRPARRE